MHVQVSLYFVLLLYALEKKSIFDTLVPSLGGIALRYVCAVDW